MEEYSTQYSQAVLKAQTALNNKNNVIVCGPEYSGKTYLKNQLIELLKEKKYDIYFGVQDYMYRNRSNGRHYNENNFWIEEINANLIANVIEDYEYINTEKKYPN